MLAQCCIRLYLRHPSTINVDSTMASAGGGAKPDPDLFFDSFENPPEDRASTPDPTNDKPDEKDPFFGIAP